MTTRATLALLAVLIAATPARAQSARGGLPPVRFGAVGGVSIASMTETTNTRTVTGAYVGGQVVLPRAEYFALQIEVAWSAKGVRAAGRDPDTGAEGQLTLRNSYIEIPILMRVDSPLAIGVEPIGAVPFVVLGPSLGISRGCSFESAELQLSLDCDDEFGVKTFDFGAMVGTGLEARIGRSAISLGVRYTFGLQDVFEAQGGRNRALLLLAGVNF